MLLLCASLARCNQLSFSATFHERIYKGLQFTRDITQLNNTIPQFGDNDNGRMLQFYGYATVPATDHRHILAVGGEFYDDDALRACGGEAGADAIWTLGQFKPVSMPAARTRYAEYQEGGYYIFKTDKLDLVIRNGRINPYCGGGHAHCDQLSFTLNWKGEDIFVDPGAYRYSSDFQARNDFRSVEYHNTIQINDLPMHEYDRNTFEGLWWMHDHAHAETDSAGYHNNGLFEFSGRIHSYENAGFTVGRKIEYAVETNCLGVWDDTVASGAEAAAPATAVSRLLLAPGISVSPSEPGRIRLCKSGTVQAEIHLLSPQSVYAVRSLWFSPSYGRRVPALQLEFRRSANAVFAMKVFMMGEIR